MATGIIVRICSLREAVQLAHEWPADHVISLLESKGERSRMPLACNSHLKVNFDDIIQPRTDGEPGVVPGEEHIRQILEFAKKFQTGERVLVHCVAGVSRSPAVAIGVLCSLGWDIDKAFDYIQEIRPQLSPNEKVLEHFDNLLGLNGELLRKGLEFVNPLVVKLREMSGRQGHFNVKRK